MNRCDCCGKFGDTEEVTITIKKHKACDVNVLFDRLVPQNLVPTIVTGSVMPLDLPKNPVGPAYVGEELKKMIL